MTKIAKHLLQFQQAQKGIELLNTQSKECQSYQELQDLTTSLSTYFFNAKNDTQSPNRYLVLFQNFLENETPKKRNIENMRRKKIAKNVKKKKNYLDYIGEYQTLRNRGYSYQKISEYSSQFFHQKVSRETIRNILKEEL